MVFNLPPFDEVKQRLCEGGGGIVSKAVFSKIPNGVKRQCMQQLRMAKHKIKGEIRLLVEDGC